MSTGATGADARADWEERIYRRHAGPDGDGRDLPAPDQVRAEPGAGHIRLDWDVVPGAAGYVIERAGPNGAAREILRHGGSDVAAVPGPPFADTGLTAGMDYRYRVAAVLGAEHPPGSWSHPVSCQVTPGGAPDPVRVGVNVAAVCGQLGRVWQMIGSERLSQLVLEGDGTSASPGSDGAVIAEEFAAALRLARDDLGATTVRAHAIFHDDNAVASREADGTLRFDFTRVDAIYDRLLRAGLRPVVELSFMPAALARDPEQTVFTYRGIISPPADWGEWRQLVTALASHLVDRYGIEEVARWAFEVWNEPNLEVFWAGTREEYLRLYDESARAIKSVDERLLVGGPSTAADEWVETLAAHAADTGVPLDFVSTHTYGNLPIDLRAALRRHDAGDIPIWWTEWGVGSTHFGPVHDGPMGAPFVLSGFHSAQGRLDALAYWVISDHFEELGRPPQLFHNGFGLLSVGNLRKPRYWAAHLAAHLGDEVVAVRLDGDGAGTLVQAWAARHDDGTVDVLVWNGTINAALLNGDPSLDRDIDLTVEGLRDGSYRALLSRIDHQHSNISAHCPADVTWPDAAGWARLHALDKLWTEPLPVIAPEGGTARFRFNLPMPGVVRLRLTAGLHHQGETNEAHVPH